jgi:hypothetical protein
MDDGSEVTLPECHEGPEAFERFDATMFCVSLSLDVYLIPAVTAA